MNKNIILSVVAFLLVLNACTMPSDQYDQFIFDTFTATALPANVKVGEPVTVTLAGSIELDERSGRPERTASNVRVGICFTRGEDATEALIDPHGFCNGEVEVVPSSYVLLNGTTYSLDLGDVTVPRGESREFEHSFTFTSTEAGDHLLVPILMFTDEGFAEPESAIAVDRPQVTFE